MINRPLRSPVLAAASAIALLLFALGCSKESEPAPPATTSSSPQVSTQNFSPPPAEAEAKPKSAIPNSFYPVMQHLDQGGSVYAYLGTEQWLSSVGEKLSGLKDTLLKNIPSEPEERAQIEKGAAAAVRLIKAAAWRRSAAWGLADLPSRRDCTAANSWFITIRIRETVLSGRSSGRPPAPWRA